MGSLRLLAALCASSLVALSAAAQTPKKIPALKGDKCVFTDAAGNLLPDTEKVRAYALHQKYEVYRLADTDCDGKLSAKEIADFERKQEGVLAIVEQEAKEAADSGKPIRLKESGQPFQPFGIQDSPKKTPKDEPWMTEWKFLLRDSAEDIGVWQQSKELSMASGAQLGFASDAAAANESWSAKGIAGLVFSGVSNVKKADHFGLVGYAVSPWVAFNRLSNSNTTASFKSKQVDVLSFGGTAEVGYGPTFLGDQYLRLKGNFNTDFELNPRSWSMTGEWQPVSNRLGLSAPIFLGQAFTVRVDPIARLQTIQRVNGSRDPIFAEHDSVWRAGPVVALTVQPTKDEWGGLGEGFLPRALQNSSVNVSYSALFDTYTGKNYYRLNTSFTLPFDEAGHVGAKFGYARGYDDQTATWVDLFSVGLALKW